MVEAMVKKRSKSSQSNTVKEKFNKAKVKYIKGERPNAIIKKLKEVYEID